jgi:hypothetical protein
MIERFVRLYPELIAIQAFHPFLPSYSDTQLIKDLFVDLAVFKDVMVRLQSDDTNIVLTRFMFQSVLNRYPGELNLHLTCESVFENALFKIIVGDPLTPQEQKAVEVFEVPIMDDISLDPNAYPDIYEEIQV